MSNNLFYIKNKRVEDYENPLTLYKKSYRLQTSLLTTMYKRISKLALWNLRVQMINVSLINPTNDLHN